MYLVSLGSRQDEAPRKKKRQARNRWLASLPHGLRTRRDLARAMRRVHDVIERRERERERLACQVLSSGFQTNLVTSYPTENGNSIDHLQPFCTLPFMVFLIYENVIEEVRKFLFKKKFENFYWCDIGIILYGFCRKGKKCSTLGVGARINLRWAEEQNMFLLRLFLSYLGQFGVFSAQCVATSQIGPPKIGVCLWAN